LDLDLWSCHRYFWATTFLNPTQFFDAFTRWSILIFWIGGSIFFLATALKLKKVSIDERHLRISTYLHTIQVPATMIANVTENRWINYHPVTMTFSEPTEFGAWVTFMPKFRFRFWSNHPVVAELEALSKMARLPKK
jgi:hypothetical protein